MNKIINTTNETRQKWRKIMNKTEQELSENNELNQSNTDYNYQHFTQFSSLFY